MTPYPRHPELDRDSLQAAMRAATLTEMSLRLHTDYRSVLRAKDGLTIAVADRWAVKAGLHPCEVWPAWLDITERERLEQERRKYRERMARYRRTTKGREATRRANEKWKASSRDYLNAARRRKYWSQPEVERQRRRDAYRRKKAA